MPYHRLWRRGCKAAPSPPGMAVERRVARLPGPWSGGSVAAPLRSYRDGSASAPAALACTRSNLRRGVPGSTGAHHGYRPPGHDWPGVDHASGLRIPRRRGSHAPARLPAEREPARRRSATRARRRRAPRPSPLGCRRWVRGHDRPPGRLARSRRGPRDRRTRGGAPPVSEQQGLLVGRGLAALRSLEPRPPRAGRVQPRRANAPATCRSGRSGRPSNLAPRAAGDPDRPTIYRSHSGQERRRLR